jgi:hypothetical protein
MLTSCRSERGINRVDTDGTLVASAAHGGETAPTSGKTTPRDSDTASSKITSFFIAQGHEDDAASVHTDPPGKEPPNDLEQEKPNDLEQENHKALKQKRASKVTKTILPSIIGALTSAIIASAMFAVGDTQDRYSHLCDDPYIHLLYTLRHSCQA